MNHAPAPDRDLSSEREITEFVTRFYRDVAQDELLGPLFNDVAQIDWADHIPKVSAFWQRALLHRPGYQGNPYRAHQQVHAQRPFTLAHFERWLQIFHDTLDPTWAGPRAEQARALAHKVAKVHSYQLTGHTVETAPAQPTANPSRRW